jgi:hypothetical protein
LNWEAELEATVTDEGAVALVGDLRIDGLHPLSFGTSADSLLVTDVVYDPINATHQAYKTASYVHVAPHPTHGAAGENSISVAGVTMTDGDYLANDATAATKDQPAEGGYAYYKDGVLTLHDYRHVSAGTTADNEMGGGGMLDEYASTALIHTEYALVLLLEGESYLENTNLEYGSLVTVEEGDLTVKGDGMLEEMVKGIDKDTVLTLEPHLTIFSGYSEIDKTELKTHYKYPSRADAFADAVKCIKDILIKNGYKEEGNQWIK